MENVGRVLWWDQREQEGVLTDASGVEFYFNHTLISDNGKSLKENCFVHFTPSTMNGASRVATKVAVVPTKKRNQRPQTRRKAGIL